MRHAAVNEFSYLYIVEGWILQNCHKVVQLLLGNELYLVQKVLQDKPVDTLL